MFWMLTLGKLKEGLHQTNDSKMGKPKRKGDDDGTAFANRVSHAWILKIFSHGELISFYHQIAHEY